MTNLFVFNVDTAPVQLPDLTCASYEEGSGKRGAIAFVWGREQAL